MEAIILNGVHEYGEEFDVKLEFDSYLSNRLCVVARNEGGFNSTWVDAEELYHALKNYFERNEEE